jgi:primosomal protein N' (replication factor Y)
LKHFGSGTQKVVEALEHQWPQLRVLRFDSDSTSRKGSHRQLLDQFRQAEADVLVGTQMLTKGLDVPQVTLVGVVAADGLLNQADFRAAERSFQILTQVAGRAGRGELAGQVLIQTYLPEHPTLQAVQRYDYDTFIQTELRHRQESGYPPHCSLLLIRLSSSHLPKLTEFCQKVRQDLEGVAAEILGPCPAQVERVRGQYRWQILLKFSDGKNWTAGATSARLTHLSAFAPREIKVSLDVDPQRIL